MTDTTPINPQLSYSLARDLLKSRPHWWREHNGALIDVRFILSVQLWQEFWCMDSEDFRHALEIHMGHRVSRYMARRRNLMREAVLYDIPPATEEQLHDLVLRHVK